MKKRSTVNIKIAQLEDLCFESWLRKRNRGEIVWINEDVEEIPIKEMSDSDLDNTIYYLQHKLDSDKEIL